MKVSVWSLLLSGCSFLTGEQYGKMEPKYPEGGHYQSVLRSQRVFNVPPFLIDSVEISVPFNVFSHL